MTFLSVLYLFILFVFSLFLCLFAFALIFASITNAFEVGINAVNVFFFIIALCMFAWCVFLSVGIFSECLVLLN